MTKVALRQTMWAELKPDVYGGPRCDKIVPMWTTSAEGDKGDGDTARVLSLDSRVFPPGTTVVISEPLCPQCGDLREINMLRKRSPLYSGPCACGFDWDGWVRDAYS